MHTLNHLTEPDMEYLWTAVDWKDIEEKFISLKIPSSVITNLKNVHNFLFALPESEFNQKDLIPKLKNLSKQLNVPYSSLMRTMRIVLTAQKDGPGIAEIIDMLGRKRCLEKLNFAVEKIENSLNVLNS